MAWLGEPLPGEEERVVKDRVEEALFAAPAGSVRRGVGGLLCGL